MSTSRGEVYINGKRSEKVELSFPWFKKPQTNVFESLIAFEDGIFCLEEHLTRLFESAKTIGFQTKQTKDEIRQQILSASQQSTLAKPIFLRVALQAEDTIVVVTKRSHAQQLYETGVSLKTSVVPRHLVNAHPPEAKTGQCMNGILAQLDPTAQDAFETLHLDREGFVKEARVWNIFILKSGVLRTPETQGILDGVTRRFVIKCAFEEQIDVQETPLTRHDVWNADEVFLTNTSGGIIPVRSLDGRLIGRSVPGERTRQLTKRFLSELKKEVKRRATC